MARWSTRPGKVVAINYAGGAQATTTEQFFGIASDLAQPVVDRLRDGSFESLGINGWAVYDDAAGISGHLGRRRHTGFAGLGRRARARRHRDVDERAADGHGRDVQGLLRRHPHAGEGAPIAVEVLRYDTSEVLKGEINGDEPLALAFSFAEEVGDEVGDDSDAAAAAYEYETVVDDTNSIQV